MNGIFHFFLSLNNPKLDLKFISTPLLWDKKFKFIRKSWRKLRNKFKEKFFLSPLGAKIMSAMECLSLSLCSLAGGDRRKLNIWIAMEFTVDNRKTDKRRPSWNFNCNLPFMPLFSVSLSLCLHRSPIIHFAKAVRCFYNGSWVEKTFYFI